MAISECNVAEFLKLCMIVMICAASVCGSAGYLVSMRKQHLLAQGGVFAFCNPRNSHTMPVVAKTLRPCPEPKSTISGWTLFIRIDYGLCNLERVGG
jgi:hypothetical protein